MHLAAAFCLQRNKNFGDSGIKSMPMARMRTQRNETPMVMRHEAEEGRRSVPKLIMLAKRMPRVMKSWKKLHERALSYVVRRWMYRTVIHTILSYPGCA